MNRVILEADEQSLHERFGTPEAVARFSARLSEFGELYDTVDDTDHQFALAYLTLRGDDPWHIFLLASQLHAALRHGREKRAELIELGTRRVERARLASHFSEQPNLAPHP